MAESNGYISSTLFWKAFAALGGALALIAGTLLTSVNENDKRLSKLEASVSSDLEQIDKRLSGLEQRLNISNVGGRLTAIESKLIPREEAMTRREIQNAIETLETRLERFAEEEKEVLSKLDAWRVEHERIIEHRDAVQCGRIARLEAKTQEPNIIDCGAGAGTR